MGVAIYILSMHVINCLATFGLLPGRDLGPCLVLSVGSEHMLGFNTLYRANARENELSSAVTVTLGVMLSNKPKT